MCNNKHLRLPRWLYKDEDTPENAGSFEDLCVLPCSHLVESNCMQAHHAELLRNPVHGYLCCPAQGCEMVLNTRRCGHLLSIPHFRGRLGEDTPLQAVIHTVPYTRNRRLFPDTTDLFSDLSEWPEYLRSPRNHYGVELDCHNCALNRHLGMHLRPDGQHRQRDQYHSASTCTPDSICMDWRQTRRGITGLWE
ncbi:hypothetical protein F5Y17DRAFT_409228 [Xylariaceae sp. FL0594]|nr:hypothetical protein F5Y17DRAFT_409228 [Xylariaceae sp. FL0594]